MTDHNPGFMGRFYSCLKPLWFQDQIPNLIFTAWKSTKTKQEGRYSRFFGYFLHIFCVSQWQMVGWRSKVVLDIIDSLSSFGMRREALPPKRFTCCQGAEELRKCQWKRGRNWTTVLQPRYGLPMFAKPACPLADLSVFSTWSHRRRGPPQDQVLQPSEDCIQDMSSQACLSYVGPVRLRFAHPWRGRTGPPRQQASLARHIRVRKLQVRLWKLESQDIPRWVW